MLKNKSYLQIIIALSFLVATFSCQSNQSNVRQESKPLQNLSGTWQLISSKVIEKGDTALTFAAKDQKMIKMFNDTHFAFFMHDLKKGADSATAAFSGGGGTYTLQGDQYKEHLEFCNYRGWENLDFTFTLTIKNDTLLQQGVEKIDSLNVDRIIIEQYTKLNNEHKM
jgi:hypothetical protein